MSFELTGKGGYVFATTEESGFLDESEAGQIPAALLPCALYYIIFKYVPIFGISIAFMDYNLFKGITESDWVGFKYFSMFLIRLISGLFSEIHSCWGYTS